jgi:site-specific recombinase XerD
LSWAKVSRKELHEISAADVGEYLRGLDGGLPKKKQHHSALRRFFNLLVERHICIINPALVARTERLEISEGKTPQITERQARQLLAAIDTKKRIGIRDRAIVGILMWTGVRAGSISRLRRGDYYEAGEQWMLRFDEKRRRTREIPVRHDLQWYLREYLDASMLIDAPKAAPLFLTTSGKTDRFTGNGMNGHDICRMVKRYVKQAGLPESLSPHSFRVAVATDLLDQGVPLSDVQYLLGHADPRTTRLYDRRQKHVTRNIVERIRLGG